MRATSKLMASGYLFYKAAAMADLRRIFNY
jgi:hypothetical protein